ncbi:MAG: LysR substrate-binding domain-containing protein [Pseudorhodoplanes sp.]|jgi:LysR family nitrogen assimilation transcriptional regulator|nr:LysR substrate-binding domain-containing protein [Pseudorhodoplanes sp.]
MELKELRNFMRVARAGSVSRAADELRLAQPALSRQISKLERELGVSLFSRHGRGVRLSAAGSLLLERAEAIVHLVRQTSDEIREDRSLTAGRVTLGVPPAAGRLLIPTFVEQFQKAWPRIALHMREGVTSSLQEWLLEKRIDIAILHNPPHLEALNISPVLTERMHVIAPPHHGPGKKPRTTFRIRDLAELPLILPSMAHNNRRLVEQAALEHGVRLRIRTEVDSVAFAKAMVERGLGYTILTYAAVQEEVARKRLAAYPIVRPALSTRVTIVTPRDQPPKTTQYASEILLEVCRMLVRSKQWAGAQLC